MILDRLPYSDRADVREQINNLFSRKMLGSVLVGKFIGDYAAIIVVSVLGTHIGYVSGIITTVLVFIYWERIERRVQQKQNEMNPSQTTMGKFQDGGE